MLICLLSSFNTIFFSGTTPLQGFLLGHNRDETELDTSPIQQLLNTTAVKPALIPPIMFASSIKDKNDATASTEATTAEATTANKSLEPLTKNQMLQALSYLLKNDGDFVQKLHEAYVKSLSEMVHHNNHASLLQKKHFSF